MISSDMMCGLKYITICLCIICFCLDTVQGNSSPIFEETNPFSNFERMITGFDILIPNSFPEIFRLPVYRPAVYLTVLPISEHPQLGVIRKEFDNYPDSRNLIEAGGLAENTWYYICVEMEGSPRKGQGKVTFACTFNRTLDKGDPSQRALGLVTSVDVTRVTGSSVGFKVGLDRWIDFSAKLDFYFEDGSVPIQSYMLHSDQVDGIQTSNVDHTLYNNARRQQARFLDVKFRNLEPNLGYGRLCVRETPIKSQLYTTRGRSIDVSNTQCLGQNIITKNMKGGDGSDTKPKVSFRAERRTVDNSDIGESESSSDRMLLDMTVSMSLVIVWCLI